VLLSTGKFVNPGQTNRPRATVPSVGLVYEPFDNLSMYASYAESFKPTPPNSVAVGAPTPDPERAEQKEVGVKADFFNRKVELLVSLYSIERKDVVEAVPNAFDPATGIQIYRSLSNKSDGVEVSINYQPVPHWQTQIGYAYNDARVSSSASATLINARLANAPQHSGNLWTRYNVPSGALRGFGIGFGLVHTGDQNLVLDNRASQRLAIPAVTRADLAFYYKWRRQEFALNVNNVTDKSYIAGGDAPTDVVPGAPRKITASVRIAF
jgi:iron complex outermembrane receptor protein